MVWSTLTFRFSLPLLEPPLGLPLSLPRGNSAPALWSIDDTNIIIFPSGCRCLTNLSWRSLCSESWIYHSPHSVMKTSSTMKNRKMDLWNSTITLLLFALSVQCLLPPWANQQYTLVSTLSHLSFHCSQYESWRCEVVSSPGHSQILSRSCGEKSGSGLGTRLDVRCWKQG